MRNMKRGLVVLLVCLTAGACRGRCSNGGGDSSGGGAAVRIQTPVPAGDGTVTIPFLLVHPDRESLQVRAEYSLDGADFHPASLVARRSDTKGLASSPDGVPHTVVWNAIRDGAGLTAVSAIVRIIALADEEIGRDLSNPFLLDYTGNQPPACEWSLPGMETFFSAQRGRVEIGFHLVDAEKNLCDVRMEYTIDDFIYFPASPGAGEDGWQELGSDNGFEAFRTIAWDSVQDLGAYQGFVKVRLQVTDVAGMPPFERVSPGFYLDNSGLGSGQSMFSTMFDSGECTGVATDGRFAYVIGILGDMWTVEKRDLGDGSMLATISHGPGRPLAIAALENWIYVAGVEILDPGRYRLRYEKWHRDIGHLGFGPVYGPEIAGTAPDRLSIALDERHFFVADDTAFVEKRRLSDGELAARFSVGSPASAVAVHEGSLFVGGSSDGSAWVHRRSTRNGQLLAGKNLGGGSLESLVVDAGTLYSLAVNPSQWTLGAFDAETWNPLGEESFAVASDFAFGSMAVARHRAVILAVAISALATAATFMTLSREPGHDARLAGEAGSQSRGHVRVPLELLDGHDASELAIPGTVDDGGRALSQPLGDDVSWGFGRFAQSIREAAKPGVGRHRISILLDSGMRGARIPPQT